MADYLVPTLLAAIGLIALRKGEDAYGHMVAGAEKGLKRMGSIAPALVVLLTGIRMLRASGALDFLGNLLAPLLSVLGIPAEVVRSEEENNLVLTVRIPKKVRGEAM